MAQRSAGSALAAVDVAMGTCLACARAVDRVAGPPARWLRPLVLRARAVGTALTPVVVFDAGSSLQRTGQQARGRLGRLGMELLDALVPVVVDLILDRIDLTALVMRRVDLDAVAAGLDIGKILDRIDLNELIEQRVDLDRIAADLDLDAVTARLDLDAIAAGLDVDAVAARLDIDRVMARVDLIGLAEFVVDGIDLPRIIRESTGSVASEGLREVRTRSMEADQALAHLVDRMLLRRGSGRDRAGRNGASDRASQDGAADRPSAGGASAD